MDLESFFYQKITTISQNVRYEPIQIIDDVLVVNFDCVFEREGTLRANDQLIYLLHKLGKDKRFLFLSEDGANIKNSGALLIIKNIIACFGLTKETCAVACREPLVIDDATVIVNEPIAYWCQTIHQTIKNIKINQGPLDKKFAVWFNRGTFYRLELAKHLYQNYRDISYISYQEQGMIVDRALKNYFKDNLDWAEQNTPIVYDSLFPNRNYDFEMIVGAQRKPYDSYFLEIVAETDILTTDWITEKTIKNLYIGKPFLVMSGHGTLAKLQSMGFKTFGPWIDESYDQITNNYLRLEAIKQEIDRISALDVNQLYKEMLPTIMHNRKQYEVLVKNIR